LSSARTPGKDLATLLISRRTGSMVRVRNLLGRIGQ
jgi:hypothetical protein